MKIKSFDKKILAGAGAVMFAALLWSLDGTFIRPRLYHLPAPLLVFLEHFLGAILLSPFIILNWKKIRSLSRTDWRALFWVALFGGLLGTIAITRAFFAAIDGSVTFATIVILQKLQPVFALVLARLVLKEKLGRNFYAWAAIAIVAAYFLAFGKTGFRLSDLDLWHNAAGLAILAAFAFGSSTVYGKRAVNHLPFGATTALRFALTSLLALPLIIATGDIAGTGAIQAAEWRLIALIVLSSGAVAILFYYYGLKRISASTATICELFWPLSAVVLDYFLNHNSLSIIQYIASAVLLSAFIMIVREDKGVRKEFTASVIPGRGRGARLGYPTLNLDRSDLDLPHGVYLVSARIKGRDHQGLLHFGPKDTFNEPVTTELYITEDITATDAPINVKIIKYIRPISKFNSKEDLTRQIKEDLMVLDPR